MSRRSLVFCLFLMLGTNAKAMLFDKLDSSKDDTPLVINAEDSIICNELQHRCIATGNASAQKGNKTVYGDVLTIFFTDDKNREITAMTADGHVRLETPTETAHSEHAHYDTRLDRILLTGEHIKIITPKETLTARESIEYWQGENKGIAKGNATAAFKEKEQVIQADTLTAYFRKEEDTTEEEQKGKMQIERVEAEGNMLASSPTSIITARKGIYNGDTELVEVFENVEVTQDNNIMKGEYGRANLKTNFAELFPSLPNSQGACSGKRISGIIVPKDAKKKRGDKDTLKTKTPKTRDGQLIPGVVQRESKLPFDAKNS